MSGFYFPKKNNLKILSQKEKNKIIEAVKIIKDKLPHEIYYGYGKNGEILDKVSFFVDEGMKDNSVLGCISFFKPNQVLLSPIIVEALSWESISGIPNNESAMSTVIHELTHLDQIRWFNGILWPFLNNPLVSFWTTEKWANENGQSARKILQKQYDNMRENQNNS